VKITRGGVILAQEVELRNGEPTPKFNGGRGGRQLPNHEAGVLGMGVHWRSELLVQC